MTEDQLNKAKNLKQEEKQVTYELGQLSDPNKFSDSISLLHVPEHVTENFRLAAQESLKIRLNEITKEFSEI